MIRDNPNHNSMILIVLSFKQFHFFVLIHGRVLQPRESFIIVLIRICPSMKRSIVCKTSLRPPSRSTCVAQYWLIGRPIAPEWCACFNFVLLGSIVKEITHAAKATSIQTKLEETVTDTQSLISSMSARTAYVQLSNNGNGLWPLQ